MRSSLWLLSALAAAGLSACEGLAASFLARDEPEIQKLKHSRFKLIAYERFWHPICKMNSSTVGCDRTAAVLRRIMANMEKGLQFTDEKALDNYRGISSFLTTMSAKYPNMPFEQFWGGLRKAESGEVTRASLGVRWNALAEYGLSPDQVDYVFRMGDLDNTGGLTREEFRDFLHACVQTLNAPMDKVKGADGAGLLRWAGVTKQ
mmetsp:Transcript_106609/g.343985  ORF Transcript_106609/g.343985 Transcript_106609/m.343985 type:complete len:205 (+) Transcript_106609:68-682(+)